MALLYISIARNDYLHPLPSFPLPPPPPSFSPLDDPREFLVETLAGLIKAKEAGTVAPGLFEGKDFGAIFGTFDVSRCGVFFITLIILNFKLSWHGTPHV